MVLALRPPLARLRRNWPAFRRPELPRKAEARAVGDPEILFGLSPVVGANAEMRIYARPSAALRADDQRTMR